MWNVTSFRIIFAARKKDMIEYSKYRFPNGLRLIVHEDDTTPMVAVNVLYDVGSKNEDADRTGFAHLFEHLMFGGTDNVPDFDAPIQNAGGENNAFTNSDITNFYITLPSENVEIALWLESDRMEHLSINEESLKLEQKVVSEEFKETCLNRPYGDVWHNLASLAYTQHPYSWPTIGKEISHVEDATVDDVQKFFDKYYQPPNAIVVIAGKISEKKAVALATKWFGGIGQKEHSKSALPVEPKQTEFRSKHVQASVPADSIYLAFHMSGRDEDDYYACDLLSDVLGNGTSSRLYQNLYKKKKLFTEIDSYITGTKDPGLFIIEGKPQAGVTKEEALNALWTEIEEVKKQVISKRELGKLKNKIENSQAFSEVNILNRAMSLAYYTWLGDTSLINMQGEKYQQITAEDILRVARNILTRENCNELYYEAVVS